MSKQQKPGDRGRTSPARAGADGAPPLAERSGKIRRDRLDTIERADDRTEAFDPHRGGLDEDPIEDLLDGEESDAAYREEARHVTPTLGPTDDGGSER